MIHEQAPNSYIQTPTPQTEHTSQPTPTRQTNKLASPPLSSRHRPAARTTGNEGKQAKNEPTRSPSTLVARRGEQTNRGRRDTSKTKGQGARGDRKSETGIRYGASMHGDTRTREATQEHEARQDGKKQASKYRPARLIARTGRRTIRNHTRTRGQERTHIGDGRAKTTRTRTTMRHDDEANRGRATTTRMIRTG